jgi:hypothetical protein
MKKILFPLISLLCLKNYGATVTFPGDAVASHAVGLAPHLLSEVTHCGLRALVAATSDGDAAIKIAALPKDISRGEPDMASNILVSPLLECVLRDVQNYMNASSNFSARKDYREISSGLIAVLQAKPARCSVSLKDAFSDVGTLMWSRCRLNVETSVYYPFMDALFKHIFSGLGRVKHPQADLLTQTILSDVLKFFQFDGAPSMSTMVFPSFVARNDFLAGYLGIIKEQARIMRTEDKAADLERMLLPLEALINLTYQLPGDEAEYYFLTGATLKRTYFEIQSLIKTLVNFDYDVYVCVNPGDGAEYSVEAPLHDLKTIDGAVAASVESHLKTAVDIHNKTHKKVADASKRSDKPIFHIEMTNRGKLEKHLFKIFFKLQRRAVLEASMLRMAHIGYEMPIPSFVNGASGFIASFDKTAKKQFNRPINFLDPDSRKMFFALDIVKVKQPGFSGMGLLPNVALRESYRNAHAEVLDFFINPSVKNMAASLFSQFNIAPTFDYLLTLAAPEENLALVIQTMLDYARHNLIQGISAKILYADLEKLYKILSPDHAEAGDDYFSVKPAFKTEPTSRQMVSWREEMFSDIPKFLDESNSDTDTYDSSDGVPMGPGVPMGATIARRAAECAESDSDDGYQGRGRGAAPKTRGRGRGAFNSDSDSSDSDESAVETRAGDYVLNKSSARSAAIRRTDFPPVARVERPAEFQKVINSGLLVEIRKLMNILGERAVKYQPMSIDGSALNLDSGIKSPTIGGSIFGGSYVEHLLLPAAKSRAIDDMYSSATSGGAGSAAGAGAGSTAVHSMPSVAPTIPMFVVAPTEPYVVPTQKKGCCTIS